MSKTATQLSPTAEHSAIEDIVLRYSSRGMTLLKKYLESDYCHQAARKLLECRRGTVLLTTGFFVSGVAETDGPPGTVCVSSVLQKLGFHPVIVTDRICKGLFETEQITVEYVDFNAGPDIYEELLVRYDPVALISIERCGHNMQNDYANMRGISIAEQTARIDLMFEQAFRKHIFTIGIGDGGNEIGMGNLKEVIAEKMDLNPCSVPVDELIVATTSNWGAYALAACLDILAQRHVFPSYQEIAGYLNRIVALGCVDGVTKKAEPSVDGFAPRIEQEIIDALTEVIQKNENTEKKGDA